MIFGGGFYSPQWLSFDEVKINTNKALHADWAVDYLEGIWSIQKKRNIKKKDYFFYKTVLNFNRNDLIDIFKEHLHYTDNISKILKKIIVL